MVLDSQQINTLLSIINNNQSILIGRELGLDFLSEYDKSLLISNGIDLEELYQPGNDSIYTSFHLGMLAVALNDTKALNKLQYKDLYNYVKEGKYIPISQRELATVQAIKNQTFADIKTLNGRIFQDLNGILSNSTLKGQQDFLKKEIVEGLEKKKTLREISNTISEKTGDWQRDFDRIVEYQSNTAYQEGRGAMFEKDELGETNNSDPDVYKLVFESACKHCLSLYTTKGWRSEPIVFKLSVLKGNGTNIGRKTADWKAIVGSTHPFCRCLLFRKKKNTFWDMKSQSFVQSKESPLDPKIRKRQPIRIKIAGKEMSV